MSPWLVWLTLALAPADNLAPNPGFEELGQTTPLTGWSAGWSRDGAASITVTAVTEPVRTGQRAVQVVHTGAQDWSLEPAFAIPLEPGDIIAFSVWVLAEAAGGNISLVARVHPPAGGDAPTLWSAGERRIHGGTGGQWQQLSSRFVAPPGYDRATPRLIGVGPARVWFDDFAAYHEGNVRERRGAYQGPAEFIVSGRGWTAMLQLTELALQVTVPGASRTWRWQHEAVSAVPVSGEAGQGQATLVVEQVEVDRRLSTTLAATAD